MGQARLLWFTLAGIVMGYRLMHPFAMLAYILGPHHLHESWDISLRARLDAKAIKEQHES